MGVQGWGAVRFVRASGRDRAQHDTTVPPVTPPPSEPRLALLSLLRLPPPPHLPATPNHTHLPTMPPRYATVTQPQSHTHTHTHTHTHIFTTPPRCFYPVPDDQLTESLLDDYDARDADDVAPEPHEPPHKAVPSAAAPSRHTALIVHPGEFNLQAFIQSVLAWWQRMFGACFGGWREWRMGGGAWEVAHGRQ